MLGPLLGDPVAAGTRWRRCAATPWPPRRGTGWSRCTGWYRPSPAPSSLPGGEQWQRAAAALVEAAIPADGQLPGAWRACALLLPHARAVLDLTSPGIWRVAQSLGYSGSYAAARDLFALIAAAHRDSADYGPEHPVTLTARHELAFWTGEAGTRPGPATSTPPCCPSASGSPAPSTATP